MAELVSCTIITIGPTVMTVGSIPEASRQR